MQPMKNILYIHHHEVPLICL